VVSVALRMAVHRALCAAGGQTSDRAIAARVDGGGDGGRGGRITSRARYTPRRGARHRGAGTHGIGGHGIDAGLRGAILRCDGEDVGGGEAVAHVGAVHVVARHRAGGVDANGKRSTVWARARRTVAAEVAAETAAHETIDAFRAAHRPTHRPFPFGRRIAAVARRGQIHAAWHRTEGAAHEQPRLGGAGYTIGVACGEGGEQHAAQQECGGRARREAGHGARRGVRGCCGFGRTHESLRQVHRRSPPFGRRFRCMIDVGAMETHRGRGTPRHRMSWHVTPRPQCCRVYRKRASRSRRWRRARLMFASTAFTEMPSRSAISA
jgi:hypothetical protein